MIELTEAIESNQNIRHQVIKDQPSELNQSLIERYQRIFKKLQLANQDEFQRLTASYQDFLLISKTIVFLSATLLLQFGISYLMGWQISYLQYQFLMTIKLSLFFWKKNVKIINLAPSQFQNVSLIHMCTFFFLGFLCANIDIVLLKKFYLVDCFFTPILYIFSIFFLPILVFSTCSICYYSPRYMRSWNHLPQKTYIIFLHIFFPIAYILGVIMLFEGKREILQQSGISALLFIVLSEIIGFLVCVIGIAYPQIQKEIVDVFYYLCVHTYTSQLAKLYMMVLCLNSSTSKVVFAVLIQSSIYWWLKVKCKQYIFLIQEFKYPCYSSVSKQRANSCLTRRSNRVRSQYLLHEEVCCFCNQHIAQVVFGYCRHIFFCLPCFDKQIKKRQKQTGFRVQKWRCMRCQLDSEVYFFLDKNISNVNLLREVLKKDWKNFKMPVQYHIKRHSVGFRE